MPKKEAGKNILTVKDQKWIAKRVGIDVEKLDTETAASLWVAKMTAMLTGPVEVNGSQLDYTILAQEMINAKVGLGFIPKEERRTPDSHVDNLAYRLSNLFVTALAISDIEVKDGLYD